MFKLQKLKILNGEFKKFFFGCLEVRKIFLLCPDFSRTNISISNISCWSARLQPHYVSEDAAVLIVRKFFMVCNCSSYTHLALNSEVYI